MWILDGQGAPARISQPIEGLYHRYVRLGYRPGAGCVYHGHLFLPILSGGLNPKGTFVCRLDRPSLPWVQLSGQGANTVSYIHRTNEGIGSRETTLLAAERAATSRVLNCSTFFEPNADVKNDPDGSTPVFVLETRTYATGGGTKNVVRHLRTRYDMVASVADDSDVDISWASDGVLINNAKWNQVKWNQFKWGSNAARWNALTCSLRQGVDRSPRCRVGKRQRYIKFRYHNADPVASLSIKEIVLFIRPSRAVRV